MVFFFFYLRFKPFISKGKEKRDFESKLDQERALIEKKFKDNITALNEKISHNEKELNNLRQNQEFYKGRIEEMKRSFEEQEVKWNFIFI